MAPSRPQRYKSTFKITSCLAPALAFIIIVLAADHGYGQSNPPPSTLRAGQSMYIVAFRLIPYPLILDEAEPNRQREYLNYDLDAERKVRKRIEEWQFFKVRRNRAMLISSSSLTWTKAL